jgi:hypothetical protein
VLLLAVDWLAIGVSHDKATVNNAIPTFGDPLKNPFGGRIWTVTFLTSFMRRTSGDN